ncbi:MAG: hypothetical protein H7039_08330 [Bryobacteraceae bacterium]|nr:hypothetical protein [Bryobacteraceae bacterium]
MENFRRFQAGPDPFGRHWIIGFRWQQNGISIRHSDTVDVKFHLLQDGKTSEKVIALVHPDLLALSTQQGRPLTDAWCLKLAALHLRYMILTDTDMDQELVTVTPPDLTRAAVFLEQTTAAVR